MLVGALAGAAAVFFSDKKNQEKAKQVVAKGKAQLKNISAQVKKNPEAFAKKVGVRVAKEAKKINKKISASMTKSKAK